MERLEYFVCNVVFSKLFSVRVFMFCMFVYHDNALKFNLKHVINVYNLYKIVNYLLRQKKFFKKWNGMVGVFKAGTYKYRGGSGILYFAS